VEAKKPIENKEVYFIAGNVSLDFINTEINSILVAIYLYGFSGMGSDR